MHGIMLMIAVNIGSNIANDCHMTAINARNRQNKIGIQGGRRCSRYDIEIPQAGYAAD